MAQQPRRAQQAQQQAKTPPATPSKQEVAVKTEGALAAPIPDFMKGLGGQGTENVDARDIETPRIKLLQAVSPEVIEFDQAQPGHFWHTIADKDLGDNLRVVPLYVDIRAILWRPRWDGGGILARSDDGIHWNPPNATFEVHPIKGDKRVAKWSTKPTVAESGLDQWGSSIPDDPNSQPAATRMQTIAVMMPDYPELGPAVLTLQRSGIRVGKKFIGKLKIMGVPSYGCYFNMGCAQEEANGDNYFNYRFEAAGFVQDRDEFMAYQQMYENFKQMGLNIRDLEDAQADYAEPAAATTDTGGKKPTY